MVFFAGRNDGAPTATGGIVLAGATQTENPDTPPVVAPGQVIPAGDERGALSSILGDEAPGSAAPGGPGPDIEGFVGINRDTTGQAFMVLRGTDGEGITLAPITDEGVAELEAAFGSLETRIGTIGRSNIFIVDAEGNLRVQLDPAQRLAEGTETRLPTAAEQALFDSLPEAARQSLNRPEGMAPVRFMGGGPCMAARKEAA